MTTDLCDEFHRKNGSYCDHPVNKLEPVPLDLDTEYAKNLIRLLERAVIYIQKHKHPLIASWHISLAIGTINCEGRSMTEIAQELNVTRQALSKGAIAFGRKNSLPPSPYMKSKESRQTFRENRNAVGLKQKIQKANDEKEIVTLLQEGSTYQNATEDTKRKWEKAAAKRRKELQG